MNYYKEIKEELLNNEIYKKGKDYCKNRKDLETYYNVTTYCHIAHIYQMTQYIPVIIQI